MYTVNDFFILLMVYFTIMIFVKRNDDAEIQLYSILALGSFITSLVI